MRKIPDGSVDLVITSPPYNLRNNVGGALVSDCKSGLGDKNKLRHGYTGKPYNRKINDYSGSLKRKNPRKTSVFLEDGYGKNKNYRSNRWPTSPLIRRNKDQPDGYEDSHTDDMPHAEYVEWQRAVLTECMRLIKPTGAIFYNHKERPQGKLLQTRADILEGYPLRQRIIWDRQGGLNFTRAHFLPVHEDIYLIAKSEFKLLPKMNALSTIWRVLPEKDNDHPAPFPVEIPLRCIRSCLEPGEAVVLDPFVGSGSTAIAAERHGVKWIGIEKSSAYCEMAERRIGDETRQRNLKL